MKFKTTQKEIKNGYYNIISIPYCDAQFLLKGNDPIAYTAGVYGWNANIHHINYNTCIVTGYRPFGESCNRDILRKYEQKARKIYESDNIKKYDTKINKINKLLNEFINVLIHQ